MSFAIFLFNTFLLALALINFLTIRKPAQVREVKSSVTILLPVRNEEENIERILNELVNQAGVDTLHILVIDDNSEDKTRFLAEKFASQKVTVISAPTPPPGWIGKVSALHAGYGYISTELPDFIISIDADVHFEVDAISRAIATLEDSQLDFLSPYPRQIALSWPERLIQPLLQWSWMSTVLLRGAERIPLASTVICNGQFLAMRSSSLAAIGGFQSVSHKVLDDIELGRSFVAQGFRGTVIDGSKISATRMYQSFSEIKAGYGKSLHLAFGNAVGSIVAALFIFITGALPLALSLTGDLIAITALLAIIGTRALSAASSGGKIRDALTHPISAVLFIYLLYFSWRNRGIVQWKGRTV